MEAHIVVYPDGTWISPPAPEEYVTIHTVNGQSFRLLPCGSEAVDIYHDMLDTLADSDDVIEVHTALGWSTIPVRFIVNITLITHGPLRRQPEGP